VGSRGSLMTATMTSSARPAGAGTQQQSRVTLEKLVQGLGPEMQVPAPSLPYRLTMMVVMVLMLTLPLVYLGLIALIGYGVVQYAIHGLVIFEKTQGRGAIWVVLIYLTPLLAGAAMIFFMFKPFFARTTDDSVPMSITQQEQPALYAVIHRLCEIVGAPAPARIDLDCRLNASAGPRRGVLSLLRGELVLRIGLPLVSTLNLAQFCAVLAHEFGHFRQAGAMTQMHVIRRLHYWIDSAVYKRDNWDHWLEQATANSPFLPVTLMILIV
jgi:Zn-dependent protease with chaperone function